MGALFKALDVYIEVYINITDSHEHENDLLYFCCYRNHIPASSVPAALTNWHLLSSPTDTCTGPVVLKALLKA